MAIDGQRDAVDAAGVVAGQKHDSRSDFGQCAPEITLGG